jgi:hypothetical protein
MSKVETISCKCGNIFAASVVEHIDASWKINREFYRLQGCIINETDSDEFKFSSDKNCCEQRINLIHIDNLLDDYREEIETELYDEDENEDDEDDECYGFR